MPPQADPLAQILSYFPARVRGALDALPAAVRDTLIEVRLAAGRPVTVVTGAGEAFVSPAGRLAPQPGEALVLGEEEASRFLAAASGASLYAFAEELRRGFLTLPGGHRVGLAGEVLAAEGRVGTLRHVTSFNVRIARAIPGVADPVLPRLLDRRLRRLCHTLVVSPPGCGKTTLLRDLARLASDGVPALGLPGRRVGLVDERSELAACRRGIPTLPVGARTDVLDRCPKGPGIALLLRSLSPRVVVTDEIGLDEDVGPLCEACRSGVTVLASAHGRSWEELAGRRALAPLLDAGGVERVVLLSDRRGPGTVEDVLDVSGHIRARPAIGMGKVDRPAREGARRC